MAGKKSLFVLACFVPFLASFGTGPALASDLASLWRAALASDPLLRAAEAEQRAAEQSVPQARSLLLPQVGVRTGYDHTWQNVLSANNPLYQTGRSRYPTVQYAVTVEQSLWNFANWATLRKARHQVQAGAASLVAARQDALLRVAERYLQVSVAMETIGAVEAELIAIGRFRDLAAMRARAGQGRRVEALEAEARFLRISARKQEGETALRDALEALREVTGLETPSLRLMSSSVAVRGPDTADPAVWVSRALENNPRLAALRAGEDVALAEVRRQQAEALPRLGLVAEHERRRADGSVFGARSNIENQVVQLRLVVPIYSGGMVAARTREAAALRDQAAAQLEAETRAVSRRVRGALDSIATAMSRVTALRAAASAQEAALRTVREAAGAGALPILAALEAERDLFFIRLELAQARHQYLLETLRLKHAVGGLSGDDLDAVGSLARPGPTDLTAHVARR